MLASMSHHELYASSGRPGRRGSAAADIDTLAADLATLRRTSSHLVFHYRGGGDYAENGIDADRICEIDSRYADVMFDRLRELGDGSLFAERPPAQRVVGCCRDFTVLFVAILVPARDRVDEGVGVRRPADRGGEARRDDDDRARAAARPARAARAPRSSRASATAGRASSAGIMKSSWRIPS